MISSDLVGARTRPFHYTVETRHIQNYAAAIPDENRIYYDTSKVLLVHPLFPVRISWKVIQKLNDLWDIDFPRNFLDSLLHQSEHLEINRPLKPCDRLVIQCELVSVFPHKLGSKIGIKLEFYDQGKSLVIVEHIGAILSGITCPDKGRSAESLPEATRVENENALWEEKIVVSRRTPYIYDGCADIAHPIHTDRKYARSAGLPDIIVQGTATLAMSVSAAMRKEQIHDPGEIEVVSAKFTNMVVPPNLLRVRLLKKRKNDLFFEVRDQNNTTVIKGGYLKIRNSEEK